MYSANLRNVKDAIDEALRDGRPDDGTQDLQIYYKMQELHDLMEQAGFRCVFNKPEQTDVDIDKTWKDGDCVYGYLTINVSDMLNNDIEWFNDMVEDRLADSMPDSSMLEEIAFEAVSVRKDGSIIFEVSGVIHEEDYEEDYEE